MNTLSQTHTLPKTGAAPWRPPFLQWIAVLLCLAVLLFPCTKSNAQIIGNGPTVGVSGGLSLPDGTPVPLLFSWKSAMGITGSRWKANDTLAIHMVGPLNLPGVAQIDRTLGYVFTDNVGSILPGIDYDPIVYIPYKGFVGSPDTPRPGNYQVYAAELPNPLGVFRFAYAFNHINVCPITIPLRNAGIFTIDWAALRGGRDGQLQNHSPERIDPEWISVWDEKPVSLYATVVETDMDGNNQPSIISYSDWPSTHYAHDADILLVPDQDYRWVLGTANLTEGGESRETGRIEWEWETQNNGSPYSAGQGKIGLPLWAMPSVGDRVYTVGRWVMDNGHPDSGDRTEIHPPRLLATMRKHDTAVPFFVSGIGPMTRASQVDIYVSGHGGGANQFYDGLSGALNNHGLGGGSIFDVLNADDLNTYFSFGPATLGIIDEIGNWWEGGNDDLIKPIAGPSAFWSTGPEERPINDMDYDFDVPLPVSPPGPQTDMIPLVNVITQAGHTTRVNEVITYTNPDPVTGLPTTAHIHLPYLGADNEIYARTLKFHWSEHSPPGRHFVVNMDDIVVKDESEDGLFNDGEFYLWTDVCGQWVFLTGLNPELLDVGTDTYPLVGATFDVYLDSDQYGLPVGMRVFTQGYEQDALDEFYGGTQRTAYEAGNDVGRAYIKSTGDDDDIGGALYAPKSSPVGSLLGHHKIASEPVNGTGIISDTSYFDMEFTIKEVPTVPGPPRIGVFGVPADFGQVVLGATGSNDLQISSFGDSPLIVSSITVSGGGFSAVPEKLLPVTLTAGAVLHVSASFHPTTSSQGTGTITINSNDPVHPSRIFQMRGTVIYPILKATAATKRTPTLVVGSITTWPVTITNTGTSSLRVKPKIAGAGFSIVLPSSYYGKDGKTIVNDIVVAPGASNQDLIVKFTTPSVKTKFVGTLTLISNDLVHPTTTLIFGAEGVPVGMRVLVVKADGTPCPVVNDLTLKSKHKNPKTNVHLKHVSLRTIDPPKSWQRIQFHYQTALPPSNDADDAYELKVKVGSKSQTLKFTLGTSEFKQIILTLP